MRIVVKGPVLSQEPRCARLCFQMTLAPPHAVYPEPRSLRSGPMALLRHAVWANNIPKVTWMNDVCVGDCICAADWEVMNRATMRQISTGSCIVLNKSPSFFWLGTNCAQLAISELKQKHEFCRFWQNTGPPWLSTQARDNSSFRWEPNTASGVLYFFYFFLFFKVDNSVIEQKDISMHNRVLLPFFSVSGSTRICNTASETADARVSFWRNSQTFEVVIGDMIIIDKGRSATKGTRLLNYNQLFFPGFFQLQAGKGS